MKNVLITWAMWLIWLESVNFFLNKWFFVVWIDNDMRQYFFWKDASTKENKLTIENEENFINYTFDIRDEKEIEGLFKKYSFDIIIHTAAQPSHDWAAKEPFVDFSINAYWTLVLLENFRKYSPKATFIFTSTNKLYWDTPNYLPLVEKETRYEIDENHKFFNNWIDESMSIDNSKHSLFWVSKLSADLLVQEYWKYFWLHTWIFRCGCVTWTNHKWAEMHWFLSYLTKCILSWKKYYIYWYKGKQVRDNIHSYDLVNMFWHYCQNPKKWEVYNAWGWKFSNISVLEAIEKIEKASWKKANYEYVDENRIWDHIWYISDVSKFKNDYKEWDYKYSIDKIINELCQN